MSRYALTREQFLEDPMIPRELKRDVTQDPVVVDVAEDGTVELVDMPPADAAHWPGVCQT